MEKIMSEVMEVEKQEAPEPEYSEIEQQAIANGWSPEGVDGKRNLSAEEFMDRKPLYDDIHSQKRKIKRLEEGIEALKQHNKVIAEKEREKAIRELKAAKKVALEEDNYDAVVEIDDRIAEARTSKPEEASNEIFNEWVENNTWYSQDVELREYADLIGTAYYTKHPTMSVDKVYEYVAKETKARYPEKFGVERKAQPAPVEGANKGRVGRSKQKYSVRDLPDEHLHIMKSLVRNNVMSEEEYLKDYFS